MSLLAALAFVAIGGCRVVDGDTLRCGRERVRLLGIDSPELPGHCRRGRVCVEGDPFAAKAALAAQLRGTVRIERVGYDVYGRTLGVVEAGGRDLACGQLARGMAVYKPNWDNGGIVARRCRGRAW